MILVILIIDIMILVFDQVGKQMKAGDHHTTASGVGIIPANTQLQTSLSVSTGDDNVKPHVKLAIQVSYPLLRDHHSTGRRSLRPTLINYETLDDC